MAALGLGLALCSCYEGVPDGAAADEAGSSGASSADASTGGTAADSEDAGEESTGELPPIDPEVCAGRTFSNVVDEATCPDVQGRGIDPELADDVEMCRRLFIDLTGAAPTRDEFEAECKDRKVGDIVDTLMRRDAYVTLGQRAWADKLLMTSSVTYYEYVADLDRIVGRYYRGEIALPELAVAMATHPGFTGRFDGQDLVGYNFLALLGRDAAPHERLDLEALFHMWEERYVERHPQYYFGYSRVVVNTLACVYAPWMCHSDLWGHQSVIIDPPVPEDYDYEGPNVLAVESLGSAQWNELRKTGELLASQPSFYEAAVDESLLRYLGYKAGVQIPLVRQKLVDLMRDGGGHIMIVDREILTSQLYRMASEYPDPPGTLEEEGSPDFWHGPMKQMTAETWLDSVEKLTGMDLGHCDHRYPDVVSGRPAEDSPYEATVWHPNSYPKDPEWPAEANKPDYQYAELARLLGGCPDQEAQLRFTGTGVMIALAQSQITQAVCSQVAVDAPLYLDGLVPEDTSPAIYEETARHIYRATTLRNVPEGLEDALAAAVDGCAGDAECNAALMSFHMCSSLLGSGEFLFY